MLDPSEEALSECAIDVQMAGLQALTEAAILARIGSIPAGHSKLESICRAITDLIQQSTREATNSTPAEPALQSTVSPSVGASQPVQVS